MKMDSSPARRPVVALLALVALTSCRISMSPLQNRMAPGEEPFAVFVADGEAGLGDLYAIRTDGGTTIPVTYTRVRELAPSLAPTGTALAFIREGVAGSPSSRRVVVMNLLNGNERVIPALDVPPDAVAWNTDASLLYIRAGATVLAAGAPPAEPKVRRLDSLEAAHADSAFWALLGTPAFGRAVECPERGVCVLLADGTRSVLAPEGREGVRWGSDSVGYFVGADFVVRPLGAGRARQLKLLPPRADPREMTFFPGPAGKGPQ
jgi:hypothetical protein